MGCLLDALGSRCWVLDFDRASGGASDEWQYVRHDLKARGSGTPASTERVVGRSTAALHITSTDVRVRHGVDRDVKRRLATTDVIHADLARWPPISAAPNGASVGRALAAALAAMEA